MVPVRRDVWFIPASQQSWNRSKRDRQIQVGNYLGTMESRVPVCVIVGQVQRSDGILQTGPPLGRELGKLDPMPEGRRPRGVTQLPRSGAAAESARLRRHRNGQEELPRVRGQGRRLGGATPRPQARGQGQWPGGAAPRPRPGAAAGMTNPTSKEPWLRGRRRA